MRRSAYMLKPGVTALLDGRERKITDVRREDDRVVITCADGTTYRRTLHAKIDLTKR